MTSIFAAVNITIGAFLIAVIILIITNIVKPLEAVGAEMRILEKGDFTSKLVLYKFHFSCWLFNELILI